MSNTRKARTIPRPLWTSEPKAAAILASCALNPPATRVFSYRFGETQERYIGERVKRLRQLYKNAQPPVDTPEWSTWLTLTPQHAIGEAVADGEPVSRRAAA